MVTQNKLSKREKKQFKSKSTVKVNNCLKQVDLPNSPYHLIPIPGGGKSKRVLTEGGGGGAV